jgi:hypothetical protein
MYHLTNILCAHFISSDYALTPFYQKYHFYCKNDPQMKSSTLMMVKIAHKYMFYLILSIFRYFVFQIIPF